MTTPQTPEPGLGARVDDERVDAFIWEVVAVASRTLDEVNGSGPEQLTSRVLKIGEEYGEAVQAWFGTTGQNPRKGITHHRGHVADELGDIAITALVAACSMGLDPRQVLADTAAKVAARFSRPAPQPTRPAAPGPEADSGENSAVDAFIWEWVSADFRTLDGKSGAETGEITLRLLKIGEEFGEAAQAWIGVIGQNPRKGVTHRLDQVAAELGDVAFGALVTISSMGLHPRTVLAGTAAKVAARHGIPIPWPHADPRKATTAARPEPSEHPAPVSAGERGVVSVRRARAGDVAALGQFQDIGSDSLTAYADWVAAHAETHLPFVAELDQTAVGAAWLLIAERIPRGTDLVRQYGDVQSVMVDPRYRNQGVGSALMAAILAEARNRRLVHVTVHSGRRAVDFYLRNGFCQHRQLLLWEPDAS